ncbi:hypothetical protein [Streptomyces sp. AK02-01A]|uniref:hypothetical protein n=1 Tax=Streptomyces sp. AK02-01A TaxID=3028648 RepID=UPI0029A1442F|nr:hypothetical protein [Streptomyces sp. AK02-01A]MDX3854920.1 hypothetical protein [Streptomyces sp. AK02-01A]
MPSRVRTPLSSLGSRGSANHRVLVVVLVLTTLLVGAGLAAILTGRSARNDDRSASRSKPSTARSEAIPSPASGGMGSVPEPPQISEPLGYAKAAAAMVWSYDTRTTGHDQQLAGMNRWMTKESTYADWASVSGQVPDPVLWSRMADNGQHADGTATEAHYPSAFRQALSEHPSAITEAYIYVVTVTGKQQIAWANGGGAEDRSVTLAVQCRPDHDCALVSIAPQVAP